jgi:hypothetical protein
MYIYQADLAGILRGAGVGVAEVPGWTTRGHRDGQFEPRALVIHHDGSSPGDSPGALDWLISGFESDVDENYDAQCWVDRHGVWHLVAAGRAQHAGDGDGWGVIDANAGNTQAIGVETDHTDGETWPAEQLASLRAGVAAICAARGWNPAVAVVGHKEYAPKRKTDPNPLDMDAFRRDIAATMTGDDVSYDDVVRALRDVLRLPGSGLAVPRGQTDNGNLAAILVGDDQAEYNRDNTLASRVATLATKLDTVASKLDAVQATLTQLDPAPQDPAATAAAVAPHLHIGATS